MLYSPPTKNGEPQKEAPHRNRNAEKCVNGTVHLSGVDVKDNVRIFSFSDGTVYKPLPVVAANIPAELLSLRIWVVWKPIVRGAKVTKPPVSARTLRQCSIHAEAEYVTGHEAYSTYVENEELAGIGMVLRDSWPFVAVDLDKCLDPDTKGFIEPSAQHIFDLVPSYAEASPSGVGCRVIAKGELPKGRRRAGLVEIYDKDRFVTVTGHTLRPGVGIVECPTGLKEIHKRYVANTATDMVEKPEPLQDMQTRLPDDDVIAKAKGSLQGAKFAALWDGPVEEGANRSELDASLCSILAFWCRRDTEQMDRLFRRSSLMRPKWDEQRGRDTYGEITLAYAVKMTKEVYSPLGTERVFKTFCGENQLEVETTQEEIVSKYNAGHCLVMVGGKYRVFRMDDRELFAPGDFKGMYSFREVEVEGSNGKTKYVKEVDLWFNSPRAARYTGGVTFDPTGGAWEGEHSEGSRTGALGDVETINLWYGWPTVPCGSVSRCRRIIDHVRAIICAGDEELYAWLTNWCAHMIQFPEEKPGTCPILQSGQGTGKGTFSDVLLRMVGRHGLSVNDMNQILGKHNRVLEDKVLVFADEALYAGSKAAADRFKNMITGPTIVIEPKGIDSYMQKSYARFLLATNAEHAAYIEADDRRFTVLLTSERWSDARNQKPNDKKARRAYFKDLWDEIDGGGVEAYMQYLLDWEVDSQSARECMDTRAKRRQRMFSASATVQWLASVAQVGELTTDRHFEEPLYIKVDEKTVLSAKDVWASYLEYSADYRYANRNRETFSAEIRRYGVTKGNFKPFGCTRKCVSYVFPELDKLRANLASIIAED